MIKHQPATNPTTADAPATEEALFDKANQISQTFVGWQATDVLGVLSILVRYAMDKHIKPECKENAFEDFRAWVFGELD